MNILDLIIFVIIAFSIATAIHQGFMASVLHFASMILSWVISLIFYPLLSSALIKAFPNLYNQLIFYADGASKIPDIDEKLSSLSFFSREKLLDIINSIDLPKPFSKVLTANVFNVSQSQTLAQYFNTVFANVILNLISFLILFFAVKLIFNIAISIVNVIKELPVLKQYDSLFGAGIGLLRALIIIYFIFALIPIASIFAPQELVDSYINGSLFAKFFINTNLFTNFIRSKIV